MSEQIIAYCGLVCTECTDFPCLDVCSSRQHLPALVYAVKRTNNGEMIA